MKSPFSRRSSIAFLMPIVLVSIGALAQNLNRTDMPAGVALDDDLFKLDSIGFTMPMPAKCNIVYDLFGSIPQGYFHPTDGSWKIHVMTVLASRGRETSTEFMDSQIETELREFGKTDPDGSLISSQASVLLRQPTLHIPIGTASRFYYRYPNIVQPKTSEDWVVRGRTIIPMVAQQGAVPNIQTSSFLVITFECLEPRFAQAKPLYEALVSRATLVDPAVLNKSRGAKVMAGVAFFKSLTPADFDAVIGEGVDRWEHLVMPDAEGGADTEIAFRQIRITTGSLADLPDLGGESNPGYIVRLRARSIIDEQQAIIESHADFFVSRDLSKETWLVRTAVYDAQTFNKRGSAQEFGSRFDNEINIRIEATGMAPTTVKPLIEGDGYISRSLIWMLSSLLVSKQTPADYGFYAYNSTSNKIGFREEALDPDPSNPGGWVVTSHITPDQPPQVSHLDKDGHVIRTVLPQGQVWTPIALPDLIELWQSKGLPTGALKPKGG